MVVTESLYLYSKNMVCQYAGAIWLWNLCVHARYKVILTKYWALDQFLLLVRVEESEIVTKKTFSCSNCKLSIEYRSLEPLMLTSNGIVCKQNIKLKCEAVFTLYKVTLVESIKKMMVFSGTIPLF